MKKAAIGIAMIVWWVLSVQGEVAAQLVRVGYSGTGSVRILQRFIHGEKLWV